MYENMAILIAAHSLSTNPLIAALATRIKLATEKTVANKQIIARKE